MGSSPSLCGSETSGVDPNAHFQQPQAPTGRLHTRESNDILAGRPPPPPYSRTQPSTNRGYVENPYGNYSSGYPQRAPVFKPNEPPPPYTSPLRTNRVPAPPLAAVNARPNVVNDPGDLWLYSEQPPSPINNTDESDLLENGDDVEDFETHPDGQLVLTSDKDYEAPASHINSEGLFEDPDFPAEPESVFSDGSRNASNIVWKRPFELVDNPRLVVDGFSRQDVVQGNLGDCWFLASLSAIAKMPALIQKIIPSDQSFTDGYSGMFRFRFWRFGRWITVVIDDRLPVSHQGRRVFASSSDPNEFWPSLVEKAYAKLHGSYSGLSGGMAADAFVDLTGGLAEVYDLTSENPDDVYGILYRGTRSGAFMCCSRKGNWRANETNNLGIVTGHSYALNRVQTGVLKDGSKIRLVKVRNPWANSTEWKGKWSDSSKLWNNLKNKAEFEEDEERSLSDGEFWMSYKDFLAEFTKVVMSTVGPDFDGDGIADVVNDTARGFHLVTRTGQWRTGINAGGSPNYLDEGYCSNPQIIISLLEPDDWHPDKGSPIANRGKCVLIVTLLQEYRRIRNRKRAKKQSIGFRIYKTDNIDRPLTRDDVMYMHSIGGSGDYINYREVVCRLVLEPGHYCVIPSTFKPDITLRFMMRIFTEKPILCTVFQNNPR
ncbi:calpain-A [Strongylocentrotus purpuratus]|uniref:Calpain catalytic domain-containing protein n=1 Tax=Strongylocentrotus purpuratus TaxID=7668 RepID=A0A7M7PA16_STRPU|nr:calpain-A [Strongylocentrotus purpuratus]